MSLSNLSSAANLSSAKLLLGLILLLGACTDLSGTNPNARIAVPPSYATYLPNTASKPYAQIAATALQAQKLPAVADYPVYGDWQVRQRIIRSGNMVTPTYDLQDPRGRDVGSAEARPVAFDTWRQARPDVLRQAANEAAPKLAALFNRLVAERRRSEDAQQRQEAEAAMRARSAAAERARAEEAAPGRPAAETPRAPAEPERPLRVAITEITGAPADGNLTLNRLLREQLWRQGKVVQEGIAGADFTIRGKIDDVAVDAKTRRLEIFWLVNNARNEEVGEIVQLEEVPAGSLDKGWGKLAVSVTDEVAGAIRDVILTHQGRR